MKKITYQQYSKAIEIVEGYYSQMKQHFKEVESKRKSIGPFIGVTKETRLIDIENISVNLLNIAPHVLYTEKLSGANWMSKEWKDFRLNLTVNDLSNATIREWMSARNFGKKRMEEVKELCYCAGVELKP